MRKAYIDNIKWVTAVIVVVYHVIYMFNGVTTYGVIGPFGENQPQDIFQYIVYPWFMLLLFTVSGMSARYCLESHTDKEFIKSRTVKLLVPSTLGLLIWGWVLGYYNTVIAGAYDQISKIPFPIRYIILCESGCGTLWYIRMLWLFSMILLLIRKVEKDRLYDICKGAGVPVLLVLSGVIYLSAQILNTPVIVVYRFGIYGAGFLIGYFILSHDEVMERLGNKWLIIGLLGITSCIAFVVVYRGESYPDHYVLDSVICNIYAWMGTLTVLSFMKKWGNYQSGFTKWMCGKSWGLYIFHYLPIAMAAWYLTNASFSFSPLLIYILVGAAGFAGGFLIDAAVSRIPVLRWCVMGIRKEKK